MSIKTLLTFGCSHTYGEKLEHPETESWPYKLSRLLGVKLENYGLLAASNNYILYLTKLNILKRIKDGTIKDYLVIVQMAPFYRDFIYNKKLLYHLVLQLYYKKIFHNRFITLCVVNKIHNTFRLNKVIYKNKTITDYYLYKFIHSIFFYTNLLINMTNFINFCKFYNVNYKIIKSVDYVIINKNPSFKFDQNLLYKLSCLDTKNVFISKNNKSFYNYIIDELKLLPCPQFHVNKEGHEIWARYIYDNYL